MLSRTISALPLPLSLYIFTSPYALASMQSPPVAAGTAFSVGLDASGTVWAWGHNGNGRLGDGTYDDRAVLRPVNYLAEEVGAIATGYNHSFALKHDGTVWAWGWNGYGQFGNGEGGNEYPNPIQVTNWTDVHTISTGYAHTMAIKSDGTLWAVGWNGRGQLGDGTYDTRYTPVPVNLTGVITVAAAGSDDEDTGHTLAIKEDGTVWAWGRNNYGQLGDGTTTDQPNPVPVLNLNRIVAISGGARHSVALASDGRVWTWGHNRNGELGDNTTTNRVFPLPINGLSGIIAIAAGREHTLALKNDGTVWSWGQNNAGQLGDGTGTKRPSPVQVRDIGDVNAVITHADHSLAVKTDGSVWGWGWNGYGQLGDATGGNNRVVPVRVLGSEGSGFFAVSPSRTLTVAVQGAGTGYVYSDLVGIDCGFDCVANFNTNAVVTLTAVPGASTRFTGWSGDCAGTSTRCTLSMEKAKNVIATFSNTTTKYTVAVKKSGSGTGTVTGGGTYAAGTTVKLKATVTSGSTFAGWGPTPCAASFTMPERNLTCTATFNIAPVKSPVKIIIAGTGTGTVTGAGTYPSGSTVQLTATPAEGSTFMGWAPSQCGDSFLMPRKPITCVATFSSDLPVLHTLSILTAGMSSGTVSGAGKFWDGQEVYLTATPAAGSVFKGWVPAPCGEYFNMPDRPLTCVAIFN